MNTTAHQTTIVTGTSSGIGLGIIPALLEHTSEDISILARSCEVSSWSDAQLISSVRCDPPNEEALDILVSRYWESLFGRCQMLTLNREKALDLAQTAWCRLLRNRRALKPDGNFSAYLATIATNIFRDSYRTARRAGPLADYQLASLDVPLINNEGETVFLESVLPDLNALCADGQKRLKIDIDAALERLTPQLREVLVARFIEDESCAEIGHRYGRTEQAVSGWVREALRQMKIYLEDLDHISDSRGKESRRESSASVAFLSLKCAI
jgi:RNA polymerase sigma-70 factor (ECF subfamily)